MTSAKFILSAFADEIADDLDEQIRVLKELDMPQLELRGVWGKNVLHLSDEEVSTIKQRCDEAGVTVSGIGSPIGKSPIADPIESELNNLRRIAEIAKALGTTTVRVFSFYPPNVDDTDSYDSYVDKSAARLNQLADLAEELGVVLYLENEKGIVGDTIARCKALLDRIDSPALQFAWDPANFVQVEGGGITDRGWEPLGERTKYVHVKDVDANDKKVVAAGEGDGQVEALLHRLNESGYQGYLALEPHLAIAGHSSGFSGPDGMAYAVKALRALMEKVGCEEVKA